MKTVLHRASERGSADYGWLKPNYYFSFSQYHNPERVRFGLLRVLNDDFIEGGGAFGAHPHDNMEIVTIPLEGAVHHKDSTGGEGIITAGEVQIMSAGSGVRHSEANASQTDPLKLFQIWIFPKVRNIEPRYDQRKFELTERDNRWQIVVSPREEDKALWINQDARFALTKLDAGQSLSYENAFTGNGVYLVNIRGKARVGDQVMQDRDALGIWETDKFSITADEETELLAIEVPMH